jgi:hypothetical protein
VLNDVVGKVVDLLLLICWKAHTNTLANRTHSTPARTPIGIRSIGSFANLIPKESRHRHQPQSARAFLRTQPEVMHSADAGHDFQNLLKKSESKR